MKEQGRPIEAAFEHGLGRHTATRWPGSPNTTDGRRPVVPDEHDHRRSPITDHGHLELEAETLTRSDLTKNDRLVCTGVSKIDRRP